MSILGEADEVKMLEATQTLVVKGFSRFFVTNQCPGLQDRACEIRPVIGYWLLTINPFQLRFFFTFS